MQTGYCHLQNYEMLEPQKRKGHLLIGTKMNPLWNTQNYSLELMFSGRIDTGIKWVKMFYEL